jgi:hypothetical protein
MTEDLESAQATAGAALSLGVARDLSLVLLSFLCMAVAVSFAHGAWFRATSVGPNLLLVLLDVLGCALFLWWNSALARRKAEGLSRLYGVTTIGDAFLAMLVLVPLLVFAVFALIAGLQFFGLR